MSQWSPQIGEILLLRLEPNNIKDKYAVAVYTEGAILGRVPHQPSVTFKERHFPEVWGEAVNQGAGYGLEVPCVYRLYEPKRYVDNLREVIASLVMTLFMHD